MGQGLFLSGGNTANQGRPWLTRGPVRGMEWGPPRSVCNGVTGGGGGGGGGGSIPFVAGRGARCDRTSCTAQRTALQLTSLSVNIRVRRKDLNTQFRETLLYSPQTIQALLDISVLFAALQALL